MPKKQTPRLDEAFRTALSYLQEDVTKLVFDHDETNFKDEHQSVFHEVYSRCTHHIDLLTIGEPCHNESECVCQEVSDEAVEKDCQRLGLLRCIPHVCGPVWQRVALADYLTKTAIFHRPLLPAVCSTKRGRPRVKSVLPDSRCLSHDSPAKWLKESPYLPVRSSLKNTEQSASRSLFTPPSAQSSNGGAAREDNESDSITDDISEDHAVREQQKQWSHDAIFELRQQTFTRNLQIAFDGDIPPHVDRNDHTIWFCLPNTVPRYTIDNHGNAQSRPLFDCDGSAPVFIQLSVGNVGNAFGTTYICSTCSSLGQMFFPQKVPSEDAMSHDASIANCCTCCRSFLDYIRILFPEFVGAEDSVVITYLLEHSPSYQGVCICIRACM